MLKGITEEQIERIRSLREAGAVERAHTIPHFGQYPVGLHTYNMLTLLFCLHPAPRLELILYILTHDAAERWSGDCPSPGKTEEGREKENDLREQEFGGFILTEEEHDWAECLDRVEFWLWCLDQEAMGNRNVENAMVNTRRWLNNHSADMPDAIKDFFHRYQWKRGREIYDL